MNKLSMFELRTIRRAACEKVLELNDYRIGMADLMTDLEDPEKYCYCMTIAEAYNFWILYFINKIHQMEVLRK